MTIDERKRLAGEKIAKALGLRKALRLERDGKPFDPPRYRLGPDHGTKTAVGVLDTILRLADEARAELAQPPAKPVELCPRCGSQLSGLLKRCPTVNCRHEEGTLEAAKQARRQP